jgi:hypothetical protein
MSSSRTITLFSERADPSQRPSSFLLSIVAHAAAIAIVSFGIIYTPEFRQPIVTRRYAVRHLDLHTPQEKPRESASKGITFPGPHTNVIKPASGRKPGEQQAVFRQTVNADKGLQTLVQPDIPDPVKLTTVVPVPTVVIWTPKKEEIKKLMAPLPELATAADVKPSMKAPNQELNLGDLSVSSTETPTARLPVLPATTSPLMVRGPNVVQLAPVTASQKSAQPTPTAIMSISDLRMSDGTATLPPVNQTTAQDESGILAPGRSSSGAKQNGEGGANSQAGAKDSGPPSAVAGNQSGTKPGEGAGSGVGEGLSTHHITLPKDGQFGAVIVGANLEDKYPETSGVWNDRVAYTVYLHVGLSRSWVLQYSLPRTSIAALAGNITRLDAPWPYNIVRPNISADAFNSDALLVHGFVNEQGKFESLTLAFPPDFPQAKFVLDALNQWQFRPAAQNGKPERVEVLIIIPEEEDEGMVP